MGSTGRMLYVAEALLLSRCSLFAGGRSVSGWGGLKFQVPPRGHRVCVQNDLQVDPCPLLCQHVNYMHHILLLGVDQIVIVIRLCLSYI
jgi:hypothetical protein